MAHRVSQLLGMAVLLAGCSAASVAPSIEPSAPASLAPSGSDAVPSPSSAVTSTSEPATEAPPGAIHIVLTDALRYEPSEISASAGEIVFFLEVPADSFETQHNMLIGPSTDEPIARSANIIRGTPQVFTVEGLEPGVYTFWCTIQHVDGDLHYQMGMVGTLTVTP